MPEKMGNCKSMCTCSQFSAIRHIQMKLLGIQDASHAHHHNYHSELRYSSGQQKFSFHFHSYDRKMV